MKRGSVCELQKIWLLEDLSRKLKLDRLVWPIELGELKHAVWKKIDMSTRIEVSNLLFGQDTWGIDDESARWTEEGFDFGKSWWLGLAQRSAGPCGVLSVVQGYMIGYVYYYMDGMNRENIDIFDCSEDYEQVRKTAIIASLCAIFYNSTLHSNYIFASIVNEDRWIELNDISEFANLLEHEFSNISSAGGILNIVVSLLLTRGMVEIRADMDDNSMPLIGSFGHCSQELMNLLLSGRATSNIFDGERYLGGEKDGICLRGVMQSTLIGYLTDLEVLGYCRVGYNLKNPRLPIWVIGMNNHYSVIFTTKLGDAYYSSAEKLVEESCRVFNQVDIEENGFIPEQSLEKLMCVFADSKSYRASNSIPLQGEDGIILCDTFIKWVLGGHNIRFGSNELAAIRHDIETRIPTHLYHYDSIKKGGNMQGFKVWKNDIDSCSALPMIDEFGQLIKTKWSRAIIEVDSSE